ncbi:hypothetical protein [Microcoleus sp. herbarium2]|uniref:hypothetical protein n=1 Tax=Microcoleus sp. herbarium2 TaxID=3055433 RepID=UPI002FD31512
MGKFSILSPIPGVDVENLARQTTVRILTDREIFGFGDDRPAAGANLYGAD